jgi:hypothetical protein
VVLFINPRYSLVLPSSFSSPAWYGRDDCSNSVKLHQAARRNPCRNANPLLPGERHSEGLEWSLISLPCSNAEKPRRLGYAHCLVSGVLQGGPSCSKLLPVNPPRLPHPAALSGHASPKTCRRGTARASRIADWPTQVNAESVKIPYIPAPAAAAPKAVAASARQCSTRPAGPGDATYRDAPATTSFP